MIRLDSDGSEPGFHTSKREEQRKEDVTKKEGAIYTGVDVMFKRQLLAHYSID